MAKTPTAPRPPRRRQRRSTQPSPRNRSNLGRVMGAAAGIASATGVLTGLYQPVERTAPTCGGSDRWSVKVANDADALAGKLNLTTDKLFTVPQINQAVQPLGNADAAGRMPPELKEYKVKGYLSYFKTEGDQDYHVVISNQPGKFAQGNSPATGESLVVEFPNPSCFAGSHATGPATSRLGQAISEARANFEDHIRALNLGHDRLISTPVPVTVTGVGFFDHYASNHAPTGHSIPRPLPDGSGQAVLELHPVTDIVFDSDPDPN